MILAFGKDSFFEEYISEKYSQDERNTTNYEVYLDEMLRNEIHCLDLNRWFIEIKDTSKYLLFPKTGAHWSK